MGTSTTPKWIQIYWKFYIHRRGKNKSNKETRKIYLKSSNTYFLHLPFFLSCHLYIYMSLRTHRVKEKKAKELKSPRSKEWNRSPEKWCLDSIEFYAYHSAYWILHHFHHNQITSKTRWIWLVGNVSAAYMHVSNGWYFVLPCFPAIRKLSRASYVILHMYVALNRFMHPYMF